MKHEDRVEVIIEATWFTQFAWSRQLVDPRLALPADSAAIPIHGSLLDTRHHAGLFVRTAAIWDAGANAHNGIEVFVPWHHVVAIILADNQDEARSIRMGFLHS